MTLTSLAGVGFQTLGMASISNYEFEFVITPDYAPYTEFVTSLVEELARVGGLQILAILERMKVHVKIKQVLSSRPQTASLGQRLVAIGKQIAHCNNNNNNSNNINSSNNNK